jgi:hypothetical protein
LLDAFAAFRWSKLVAVKRDDLDVDDRLDGLVFHGERGPLPYVLPCADQVVEPPSIGKERDMKAFATTEERTARDDG